MLCMTSPFIKGGIILHIALASYFFPHGIYYKMPILSSRDERRKMEDNLLQMNSLFFLRSDIMFPNCIYGACLFEKF